jgi:hypothetical protein
VKQQELSQASSTSAPRIPGNREEHPGAKKNVMEALTGLYESSSSVWGPTSHVIYSQI